MTIAPWFTCRIMTIEKESEFGFTFKTTPLTTEYIQFSIRETDFGVWVTCRRKSKGLLSIINQMNWQEKSEILQHLDKIVPKVNFGDTDTEDSIGGTSEIAFGGFGSRQDYIDYGINMGMQDNMDYVNGIPEKPIRGMVKAGIVKAKRTGIVPNCPEKSSGEISASSEASGVDALSKDDMVAYLVNKGLDGDMDEINELAKRKGLIVIDDSARTIDGYYKNKAAGRLADITVFSFESKKHLTTGGEGGMVVTDNEDFAKKIRKFIFRLIIRQ